MSFTLVLYDHTSAANTALDTGALNTMAHPIDALCIEVRPSGGMTSGAIQLFDPDLSTNQLVSFDSGNGSTPVLMAWGTAVSGPALTQTGATSYLGGLPAPVPNHIRVVVPALGAGITARLRIVAEYSGR